MTTVSSHAQSGNMAFIYGLVDPRVYEVFYVGRTSKPLHVRLSQHIRESRQNRSRKKAQRICTLLQEELSPLIVELEQVSLEDSIEAEGKWISYYASLGITLLNTRDHYCGSFPYASPLPSAPKRRTLPKEVVSQLGKMPDSKLGEIYGLPHWVVTRARNRRNILSFDEQQNYPSRIKPGKRPANAYEKRIHLSQEAIDQLGRLSDAKLAKMYGVSASFLRNERTRRGILPFKETSTLGYKSEKWNTKLLPQEAIDQLGKVRDCELAKQYGVSNSFIASERRKHNIPSFDEQHGFPSRIRSGHHNELRWRKKGGDA